MVEWEELDRKEQDTYLTKARFLIENNYKSGEVEDLAKIIYHTFLRQDRDNEREQL